MKKSFGNYSFLAFGLLLIIQLFFFIEGGFIPKIAGFGVGIVFTLMLMVICNLADFSELKKVVKR